MTQSVWVWVHLLSGRQGGGLVMRFLTACGR
jgi:hypothetical protein